MAAGSQSFDDDRIGLFDLPHDAFFIAAFDGYLKRANPAFARSLGYTLEEMLAWPYMDRVHPDDVEAVKASTPNRPGVAPSPSRESDECDAAAPRLGVAAHARRHRAGGTAVRRGRRLPKKFQTLG
jgi:PAS domain-containing protein